MQQSIILCFFIMCGLIFETSTLRHPGCGRQNTDFYESNNRIIGGSPAEYMEYPWIVSLQSTLKDWSKAHLCTASIIHPKFILTAGHCFLGLPIKLIPFLIIVVAGAGNLKVPKEKYRVIHRIRDVLYHPQFNISEHSVSNDIALLKLEKSINLGPKSPFRPICLPTGKEKFSRKIMAVGWGCLNRNTMEHGSPILMKAVLPTIDIKTCKKLFRKNILIDTFTRNMIPPTFDKIIDILEYMDEQIEESVSDRNLCTYHKIKSACKGDSGGPGMCINSKNNLYYACGVASFTNLGNTLSIYAKVAEFTKWISNSIIQSTRKQMNDKEVI